jgi:hypothetical protein
MSDTSDRTEAAIRSAKAELDRAEQLARLDNDPTVQTLQALRAFLDSMAAMLADQQRQAAQHRLHIDQDFRAVQQARDSLHDAIDEACEAAKAQTAAAHADLSRQFVASFAKAAENRLAAMSRQLWWRTLTIGSALAAAILLAGVGLGYWCGDVAGFSQAATTIRASGPVEQVILASQGATALGQWHQLMLDNNITSTMKTNCAGSNMGHQNGRTACHLWLWTTPYTGKESHE